MNRIRIDALSAVLDELAAFEIDWNQYYSDLEPQSFFDIALTAKINSLRLFCKAFGWSTIVKSLDDLTPLGGNAFEALEIIQSFVIPEAHRLLAETDVETTSDTNEWFWRLVHPQVAILARPRFEAGFLADAVETVYKEVNDMVKRIFKDSNGSELDGARLMTTAFSVANPVIQLTTLDTQTDKNIQQVYMQIMAGAMTGIRNPKAHSNLELASRTALHLICLASLLMYKIDERVLPVADPMPL